MRRRGSRRARRAGAWGRLRPHRDRLAWGRLRPHRDRLRGRTGGRSGVLEELLEELLVVLPELRLLGEALAQRLGRGRRIAERDEGLGVAQVVLERVRVLRAQLLQDL